MSDPINALIPAWQAYFGDDRWTKLLRQMQLRGLTVEAVASHIESIRGAQCEGNEAAWQICAAHHLIRLCGGVPSVDDCQRLREALVPAPVVPAEATPAKPKRGGGKADPAPPPAN